MNLEELVTKLDDVDSNLIIFQKIPQNINSEIILHNGQNNTNGVITVDGVEYKYLIEIFIAKDFLQGWFKNIKHKLSNKEIAETLFHYGIYDA